MMFKKALLMIAGLLVVVALIGCSDSSDSTPSYSAPKVLSAEELPASNATVGTEAESKAIFIEALESLNSNVEDFADSSSAGSIRKARLSQTETYPIDFTETFGGGTIACEGNVTAKYTYPDDDWTPTANKWYNNLIVMKMTGTIDSTITNCTVPVDYYAYSYIMNGESKEKMYMDMNFDFYVSDTDYDFNIDLYSSLAYGASYSLKRTDNGLGGKFVITYASVIEKDDISTMYMDVDPDYLFEEMAEQTAELKVYNDANELQYTINIPLDEIPAVISTVMNSGY